MRSGISITVSPSDHRRLEALVRDRNTSQKHVWRAEIVLLTADGIGTNEIMRRTGKSKTCVWRWQERFAEEGFKWLAARQELARRASNRSAMNCPIQCLDLTKAAICLRLCGARLRRSLRDAEEKRRENC